MSLSSHILHVLLISFLTEQCKTLQLSKAVSLQILCYLKDSIDLYKCSIYHSLSDFESYVLSNWTKEASDVIVSRLYPILQHYASSVDNFLDLREFLVNIFVEDSRMGFNSLTGPCRVTNDSSVGIFVRCFIAEWDNLSFEKLCDNYEQFSAFVQLKQDMMDESFPISKSQIIDVDALGHLIGTNDEVLYLEPDLSLDESSKIMFHIQKYMAFNDFTSAEELMHQYYDYNGPLSYNSLPHPSSPQTTATYFADQKINSLLTYIQNSTENFDYSRRHQNALLSLSMLWMKYHCTSAAENSLEEGLKIAHQRDDHVAVAKALLLLYHHQRSEDLLVRCIDRCLSLNQKLLTAQATSLLAQHRAFKQLINPNQQEVVSVNVSNTIQSNKLNCILKSVPEPQLWDCNDLIRERGSSPQALWILMLSALFGDMKLSSIISKHKDVSSLEQELLVYSASSASISAPNNPNSKTNNQYLESCLSTDEYRDCVLQVKKASSRLWHRLGMHDCAIIELQSLLSNRFMSAFSNEELMHISCDIVVLIMDRIDVQLQIAHGYGLDDRPYIATLKSSYQTSIEILNHVQQAFPALVPSSFERSITLTRRYVCAVHGLYTESNMKSVLKNILTCLDLSSSVYNIMHTSSSSTISEMHARCMVLHGRVLESISAIEAYTIFEKIEDSCGKQEETIHWMYIAMVLRANLIVKHKFAVQHEALILYIDAIKGARTFGYPVVEQIVSMQGSNELILSSHLFNC